MELMLTKLSIYIISYLISCCKQVIRYLIYRLYITNLILSADHE